MPTNCVKVVKKSVKKSAQKTWSKNVQKTTRLGLLHVLNEFYSFFDSFAQFILTSKSSNYNLLNGDFYTFSTDTTNTTILYKEGI